MTLSPTFLRMSAVAIGLVAAGACARSLGHWEEADSRQLEATLEACELPTRLSTRCDCNELIERMGWDKKVRRGTLTIIVPDGRGSVRLHSDPTRELLEEGWRAVGAR